MLVIFKRFGTYCVTTEENYNTFISNERAIQRCPGFKTAQEVIDYYVKYGWAKPEDFIIEEE